MTLFLSILKVIGIILLVIIAFILFLLIVLLVSPIHYRAKGYYANNQYELRGKLHFFFHALTANVLLSLDEDVVDVKLFGFYHLYQNEKQDDIDEMDESTKTTEESGTPEYSSTQEIEDISYQNKVVDETNEVEDKAKQIDFVSKTKKRVKKNKVKKNIFKNLKKKYIYWKNTVTNPIFEKALTHLKKEFVRFLKVIQPKRLKLQGSFSTGSPDTTGLVLGVLAMFPVGYQYRWKIVPDFESEELYIDGQMDIKGHFCLFPILMILIRIVFDKNCRKLYNRLRR